MTILDTLTYRNVTVRCNRESGWIFESLVPTNPGVGWWRYFMPGDVSMNGGHEFEDTRAKQKEVLKKAIDRALDCPEHPTQSIEDLRGCPKVGRD